MKKFLTICIIAMISAGIYGFIDMGREIHNGTMIKYEDQSAPKVKAYTRAKNQVEAKNNISEKLAVAVAAKKKLEEESKKKLEVTNIKFEDFSRGEEIYIPTTEIDNPVEETITDVKADTAKTVTPPTTAQVKEVPEVPTTVAVVEEPSLNERMFSRGSPKYYKKSLAKK